jgi:RND family efflux transporter MFP subunit
MWKRYVVVVAVVAVAGVGLSLRPGDKERARHPAESSAGAAAAQDAERRPTVSTMAVQSSTIVHRVGVSGTLRAADEAVVTSRIAGRVAWVIGKEGTPVRRGQVVVRLDDTDAQARVRSARAALEGARARLKQAKASAAQQTTATDSGILNAEAAVAAAEAALKQEHTNTEAQEAALNAQVKAAQAALDAAQSQLALRRKGARDQERSMAEQAVRLAQATYDNAKTNYDRALKLFKTGAIAKADLDGAETQMRVSKAQLESAKEQLSLVETGSRQEEIQAAEAAVRQAEQGLAVARANLKQLDVARGRVTIAEANLRQAKAGLETARANRQVNVVRDQEVLAAETAVRQAEEAVTLALQELQYTQIEAPVDGVVSKKQVEVGQSISPNVTLLQLAATDALYFEASVPELQATSLRAGQKVDLRVDALKGDQGSLYSNSKAQAIEASVERVVPVVDQQTRSFTVRVTVPQHASLMPGMFARGSVIVARHEKAISVPRDTLVEKGGGQTVFVVEDGVARARPVSTGVVDGNAVQIIKGLAVGDQVVTAGQQTLADGDQVRVVTPGR